MDNQEQQEQQEQQKQHLNIPVPDVLFKKIENEVDAGRYSTKADFVRDAIRDALEGKQLKDEIEQLKGEKDAAERLVKEPLVDALVKDVKSKNISKENLMKFSIQDLKLMRQTFNDAVTGLYGLYSQEGDQLEEAKKPQLTVGVWNPETKKWEGGLPDETEKQEDEG